MGSSECVEEDMDYDYLLKRREIVVPLAIKGQEFGGDACPISGRIAVTFIFTISTLRADPSSSALGILRETFNRIPSLVEEARQFSKPNITIMLVGNECDLEIERAVSKEDGEQFAEAKWSLICGGVCCNNSNVEE
ncbi:hypothetical protein SLE2022_194140 [Rubroshorea leprosula]